ncbi:putative monovalent cation/H+ antiporter subunit C [Actinomadura rubteroloni]|uniref:Putative monovalent cation/H+ antiporter subunit C n=1 Tax=Actinomadura rubteroloni TaxID=1926885 RepID=A0A2P4UB53_9ACTN|nr:sodium:proton antiporter [Actinomadura rubteroloni]POM22273.1 putative monovalent cation/H+ antiporter subunit C [Actinomadura rubteroloni]
MSWAVYLVPLWILLVGVYGVATTRDLVHAIVCVSVAQSSTYVLLLLVGYHKGGTSPVFSDIAPGSRPVTDPVVQAMALTDIVVGATITAMLLALAVQVAKRRGTLDPGRLRSLESAAPREPR